VLGVPAQAGDPGMQPPDPPRLAEAAVRVRFALAFPGAHFAAQGPLLAFQVAELPAQGLGAVESGPLAQRGQGLDPDINL
jgi:hypothetical protein